MKIYFATDHAGLEEKNALLAFVRDELGYEVHDCGAYTYNKDDDYPDFIHCAARAVSEDPEHRKAVILGGSGQGEAMVANRHPGVRAAVYYGEPTHEQIDADGVSMDMITSTREHNDANVLSFGARFLTIDEMKQALKRWLECSFSGAPRHMRRIQKIDLVENSG